MSRAETKARSLLEKTGMDQIPVPVEKIAEGLGVKLRYEPFEGDISGMLFRDEQRTIIGVNSRESLARQRFTISHEIGHLLLHRGRPMFVEKHVHVNLRDSRSSTATNQEEIEANQFAAELLMPNSAVRREALKRLTKGVPSSGEELAEHLAKAFRVSKQAMEFRLTNLGILFSSD